MCLSTVMQYHEDPAEAVSVYQSITNLEIQEDTVVFTDLFGDEHRLRGVVTKVDFVSGNVYVAV